MSIQPPVLTTVRIVTVEHIFRTDIWLGTSRCIESSSSCDICVQLLLESLPKVMKLSGSNVDLGDETSLHSGMNAVQPMSKSRDPRHALGRIIHANPLCHHLKAGGCTVPCDHQQSLATEVADVGW